MYHARRTAPEEGEDGVEGWRVVSSGGVVENVVLPTPAGGVEVEGECFDVVVGG